LKDDNSHIGNIGLGNIDYVNRHCMLNVFIADKTYRHKGLGYDSVIAALDFAFLRLNMNKVWLQTSERYTGAIALYSKIGFKQEGVLRQHYFSNGKYEDKIIYSILSGEYRGRV